MTYDEELAARIRELVAGEPDLTEQRMFGGLAFLIGGNMAVAASGQGGALVRADPLQTDDLVATTDADAFEMRGRPMQGWLRLAPEHLRERGAAREVGRPRDGLRALTAGEAVARGRPDGRPRECRSCASGSCRGCRGDA